MKLLIVCVSSLFLLKVCTCLNPSWDSKIVGGDVSAKGKWPWMLSLQRLRPDGSFSHTCGSTLLTDTWILTAAHCVFDFESVEDFKVLVGAFNITAQDEEEVIDLKTILAHPGFNMSLGLASSPYDIAVAELDRPVDLNNKYIGMAKLPREGDAFPGNKHCWATGWGRVDPDTNDASPVLKEVHGPVWTLEKCIEIWENFDQEYVEFVDPSHVCFAGPKEGGCHGDSGGPLNCDVTGNGDWVVAGITSWVGDFSCQGATTMYLGTEPWLEWIQDRVPGLPGVKP